MNWGDPSSSSAGATSPKTTTWRVFHYVVKLTNLEHILFRQELEEWALRQALRAFRRTPEFSSDEWEIASTDINIVQNRLDEGAEIRVRIWVDEARKRTPEWAKRYEEAGWEDVRPSFQVPEGETVREPLRIRVNREEDFWSEPVTEPLAVAPTERLDVINEHSTYPDPVGGQRTASTRPRSRATHAASGAAGAAGEAGHSSTARPSQWNAQPEDRELPGSD